MPDRRYRAFISYSQRDTRYAHKLHRALEAYKLPRHFRSQQESPKGKVGRIFRDDDEMGAVSDLGASLKGAIEDSENLIVIASPHAAQSRWVNEEILHFKRTGRGGNIFAVIVGGTPHASESAVPEEREHECFPPALRFEIDDRGELTDQPSEPLGIDFRKEPFPRLLTRLVSGLIKTPFDTLWQRQQRRQRQRAFIFGLVGLGVVLLMCAAIVFQIRSNALSESTALTAAASVANDAARSDILEPDRQAGSERALRLAILASRESGLRPVHPQARNELARASANTRKVRQIETGFQTIKNLAYSSDGETLLIVGTQKVATLDPVTGALLFTYVDTGGRPARAQFFADTTDVLIFEDDTLLRVDGRTGQIKARFEGHQEAVDLAIPARDQAQLFTRDASGAFRVWNSVTGDHVATIDMAGWRVRSVAFDPAGTPLWVTDELDTNAVYLWDGNTGAERAALNGHEDYVSVFRASPNGEYLATGTGYRDGSVRLWSMDSGDLVTRFPAHGSGVTDIEFSPDNRLLVSLAQDTTQRSYLAPLGAASRSETPDLNLFNVIPRKDRFELEGHQNLINSIAWSPNSQRILTTSDDTTARIWNTHSGKEMIRLEGHDTAVRAGIYSPDGTQIVTASDDGSLIFWDAAEAYAAARERMSEGEIAGRERQLTLERVAWVPREIHSEVSGYRVRQTESGDLMVEHDTALDGPIALNADRSLGDSIIMSVAFSPDGKLIVTASADGAIRLFEAPSGTQLAQLRGKAALLDIFDPSKAPAATFSHDGLGIYAMSVEDEAIYWDISNFIDDDIRQAAGMDPLRAAICDPRTGLLPGDLRLITVADTEAVPILAGRDGEDVCAF